MIGHNDYKEMYYTMVRAAEKAINSLVEAQRKCEQLYLNTAESNIRLLRSEEDRLEDLEQ